MTETSALYDREELLGRIEGDEDLLQEVIAIFLEDLPHQREHLQQAHTTLNPEDICHSAHTIKGVLLNLAAVSIADVAYEIEEAGRHNNLQNIDEKFARLDTMLDELIIAFKS